MLRRSHKKSRGGCLECKRRHVKCDENRPSCRLCTVSERECSFTSQAVQDSVSTSDASSRSISPRHFHGPEVNSVPSNTPLMPSSLYNAESSKVPANSRYDRTLDEPLNFDHLELLAHLTIDKDLFNLGVGLNNYYSGLALGLRTSLKWPYLMHQILAYSARHLAFLHPDRSGFYTQQAVALQTRAVSLFTAVPMQVDQSNCMPVLFFSSVLGHHLLADTLAKRDSNGLDGFVSNFVQCAQTYRGVQTIAISAWPLLMETELAPILTLSSNFTSREPVGHDCQLVRELVDGITDLSNDERIACSSAVKYLQVGLDAVLAKAPGEAPPNRYQMISEWAMLVPPEFTSLLATKRPETLIILAHYAALLHLGRHLWQVGDAGAYIIGIIGDYLGPQWDQLLEYPRQTVAQSPG
ncbi:Nn.00g040080.m01.CDS01 [Neocucurbitaria sp. VM-36]